MIQEAQGYYSVMFLQLKNSISDGPSCAVSVLEEQRQVQLMGQSVW